MADKLMTLMPAAIAVFAVALGVFGGMSYGVYHFLHRGQGWVALAFLGGLMATLFVMVSALRNFFVKFSGRILFALWFVAILGSYFAYLFQHNAYPMGIDLAGGSELIYVLDYTNADKNIESANNAYKMEKAKSPDSQATKDALNVYQTMVTAKESAPEKAAEVVRKRIDPAGTKGIPVTTLGTDKQRIRIQLPKATPEEVEKVKQQIRTQGRLTFHIVTDDHQIKTETEKSGSYVDPNSKQEYIKKDIVSKSIVTQKETKDPIVVRRLEEMDGSSVIWAGAAPSEQGQNWEIRVRFSPAGAVEFGRMTSLNKGKRLAIVLDGIAHSAPTIQDAIYGECQITGNFTMEQAERLAGVLTAGSLPAEVMLDTDYTVGPTLGREQINSGMLAVSIAAAVVIIFILGYYRLAGAVAAFCTVLNLLMLLGAMGFFKATLTLPGIAGIVLTLGMSVDANVLILERLREELKRGRSLRLAVSHGFERAFLTIIDCNLTTLISGLVLYYLGTGPVRGFAVSLSIGILTTLFCNLWLNWIIMEWMVTREALSNLKMMQMFDTPNFNFMKYRKPALIFTGLTALIAAVLFMAVPRERLYDVDFTGGTLVQFSFAPGKEKDEQEVKRIVETQVAPAVQQKAAAALAKLERRDVDLQTQSFDIPEQGTRKFRRFTITTRITDQTVTEALDKAIQETFKADLEPPAIETTDKAVQVRFNKSANLADDKIKQRIRDAALKASGERSNEEIKTHLEALQASAVSVQEGYSVAEVSPLPADPATRDKVVDAVKLFKLEDRAGGGISRKGFGAQVAGEMKWQALIALIIANLGVFIYLWFRFEFSGGWGFGAIVALVHDVLIAVGAVVVANLLGFPILFNLNIVAALLSIIGFSVNDTIVTFDRIREVKAAHPTRSYEEIVNEAVNATLGRTLLTSLTVILADLSLLIFGGPTIKDLAFTLLVGFVAGVYSSVFIAAPLMIWWYRRFGTGQALVAASSKSNRGTAPAEAQA